MFLARTLFLLSSLIVLVLGGLHLAYTFNGPKFDPRDADLKQRMQEVSPRITGQTTMWRCWVGFNASHSLGILIFGLVYGYLALMHAGLLFDSWFLLGLGLVVLGSYTLLARSYWFSIPFRGVSLALVLYAGGWLAHAFSGILQRAA